MGEYIERLSVTFSTAFREEALPFLRYTGNLSGWTTKVQHAMGMKKMFEDIVKDHEKDFDPEAKPRVSALEKTNFFKLISKTSFLFQDFIEVYLKQMQGDPMFNRQDLLGLCMDFFEAGGETVGSTLSWALLYMVLNPKVQEKCQQEIDDAIGTKAPTLEDKTKLPYCNATIMEIQRMSCVAPGGLEHKALEDTMLGGYKIPKGMSLIMISGFF